MAHRAQRVWARWRTVLTPRRDPSDPTAPRHGQQPIFSPRINGLRHLSCVADHGLVKPPPPELPPARSPKWHSRRSWDGRGYLRVRSLANPRWNRDMPC
jgi:hypothetical protein